MQKQEVPLEPSDIKKLRSQLLIILIFPLAFLGIFFFIFHFVLQDVGDSFPESSMLYPFILFGIFFIGVIGFMAHTFISDIRGGIKLKISGTVTDKRLNITHRNRTGKRSRSSSSTKSYFLYIEDEEFQVEYQEYSRARVGDEVIIEKAPKSQRTLYFEIIENDIGQAEVKTNDQTFLQTKMQDVRFDKADMEALKRRFQLDLKSKLIWMIPISFILVSLISVGYLGLLIFLFPLVIIPVVQLFLLIKRISKHVKDKQHGYKEGITAIVEDKLTITSNRATNKNTIRTTWRPLHVSTLLYDKLETGDKIIIFKPKYDKNPLSVVAADGQETYLI